MSHRIHLLAALVLTGTVACTASRPAAAPASTGALTGVRPTEPFRREHAEIKEHLVHMSALVADLTTRPADEQRADMNRFVAFMREHITPHAEWEEKVLYPAVDARAASGPNRFTASMRYEHRIVGRWTGELAAIASQPAPDAAAFARRADNLLGLIGAHFEEEEEVLLPILDRTMSKEQFEKEIGSHDK